MAKINYSAAELEALLDSVKPQIVYTALTGVSTLAQLQTALQNVINGMSYYSVRWVRFTPSASFSTFNQNVYTVMITIPGSRSNAMCVFYKVSGGIASSVPRLQYYPLIGGTWGSLTTITV